MTFSGTIRAEAKSPSEAPDKVGTKPRILVVDDDSFMRSLLARLLSVNGYRVFEADHGDAAVDIASRERLDLVLLDLLLPGEDGYSVCRRIKNLQINGEVPVVFLTGMRNDEEIAEAYAAGGIDCMVKPFEPRTLLKRVKLHLKSTIQTQAPAYARDEIRPARDTG
jgi:DNA-binding response OmpR family regulator